MDTSPAATTVAVDPRHVSYTHVMYALHALTVLTGIFTSALIAISFVFSLPAVIAVVMNYVRRSEVSGTWLASHFRWQLRTFWFAALLLVCSWPLMLTIILIPVVWVFQIGVGLWVAYRVVRAWLALRDGRVMPGKRF